MLLRIADLIFSYDFRDGAVPRPYREYLAETPQGPVLPVSEEKMKAELARLEGLAEKYSLPAREAFALMAVLSEALSDYDALLCHCAVVVVDGEAYGFSAPSGTGKSTHVSLWLRCFGERAYILNGDKPVFRRLAGQWFVYGSPWRGKENWGISGRAPLKALCFLARGQENHIERLEQGEALGYLLRQMLLPRDAAGMEKLLCLTEHLLLEVPCYRLQCDISEDAVWTAWKGMNEL